jgi:hypothetical protein
MAATDAPISAGVPVYYLALTVLLLGLAVVGRQWQIRR